MNAHIYAHGDNLFDAATNEVTTGKYISSEGVEKVSSGSGKNKLNHTDYMSVTPGHQYKYKWSGPALTASTTTASIALFDENLDFISRPVEGQYPSSTASFELDLDSVPNNAAYAILNFPSATWPNSAVDLEFYDKALAWRDYTPHLYSAGNNIFDYNSKHTELGYVDSEYVIANGSTISNGAWYISEYIDITGIDVLKVVISGETAAPGICFYDDNNDVVSGGQAYAGRTSFTLIVPTGATKVRMSIKTSSEETFKLYPLSWTDKDSHAYTSGSWT